MDFCLKIPFPFLFLFLDIFDGKFAKFINKKEFTFARESQKSVHVPKAKL